MIRVLPDAASVIDTAAALFTAHAEEAARAHGRFAAVLSGGSTPRPLYEMLAAPPLRERLPWRATHLFWSDERCVPPGDAASNQGLVRRALLDAVDVPEDQIHAVSCEDDATTAAAAYERDLLAFGDGNPPRFDLVLLGMGSDGHTASLFPGEAAVAEPARLTAAARGPGNGPPRVTLTLPLLNHAASVIFLVTGADKAEAVRRLGTTDQDAPLLPAARIRPVAGELVWLLDDAAAAELESLKEDDS